MGLARSLFMGRHNKNLKASPEQLLAEDLDPLGTVTIIITEQDSFHVLGYPLKGKPTL
jgi:hypothetical protein